MKSILDVEVSCFPNYYEEVVTKPVNLLSWLQSARHYERQQAVRQISNKALRDKAKAQLPAITPHGLFEYRAAAALIKHSGLMQFDIDYAGQNTSVGNFKELKQHICNIPNVAYCGLSVSGTGYWGLIPIAYPEHHTRHFEALEIQFAKLGIELDTKPKNVASLRGYAYDEHGYYNHSATVFKGLSKLPMPKPLPRHNSNIALPERIRRSLRILENKKEFFTPGNQHNYLQKLCSIFNKFGITQDDAEAYIDAHLIPLNQIHSNCIKDPYKRYRNDFGTWCGEEKAGGGGGNAARIGPCRDATHRVSTKQDENRPLTKEEAMALLIKKNPAIGRMQKMLGLVVDGE